jgi:6-phosphogluconate dehydrogenase (decarboxylating)
MSKVAFLGLGAMGSRMATNLLRAGHELTVWNKTPEPTMALVASGAKAATRHCLTDPYWANRVTWGRAISEVFAHLPGMLHPSDRA